MGDMLLRGVPEAIKTELAQFAKEDGKSLSEKAIDVLRKGLLEERAERHAPTQSVWDALRNAAVAADAIDYDGEFTKIMQEAEAEGKRDFGRQPPDFE